MAYRIRSGEEIDAALRRIAVEQIDAALGEIGDPQLDRYAVVHQVRKRAKKLRGLLRLVRPGLGGTYATENACYRDAARGLSRLRDAESIIEALDALGAKRGAEIGSDRLSAVRQALVARRERLADQQLDLDDRLSSFAERLREGRERVGCWSIAATGYAAVAGGLKRTYLQGHEALKAVRGDPSPENLHEWRKRVKYGWYHHRLLRDVWEPEMNVRRKGLAELGDLLGDDHDLVMLRQTLQTDPPQFGGEANVEPLLGPIERYRKQLQKQARRLGRRLFAEGPTAFRKRIGRYWEASQLVR